MFYSIGLPFTYLKMWSKGRKIE